MAKRPNAGSSEQLTPPELVALRKQLAAMSRNELETYYKATHNACRYSASGHVPCPRVVQELVQAWKQLRKLHKGLRHTLDA